MEEKMNPMNPTIGLNPMDAMNTKPTTKVKIIKRYQKRFPGDEICNSLANWETVEIDNPEIFAGMYQFWLKRHQGE